MECAHCRTDNPARFRFCGACGQRLAATPCNACGFSTPLPFPYCGNCGSPLELTGTGQSEERKLATVLFADVVGFTSLADDSDPEEMARLVDSAFRLVGDIVVSHGGTVDKYIGDSVMAVFGVPQTHEDDAERAVAAALAIQAAETGLGFAIGVNTGEVMVMAMGGGAVTVMGDAVNVAARLEKAANHGEVLVGPLTAELTANRVSYRERPPMTLKGKREPVEVRQALAVADTVTGHQQARVPLVGRDEELEFLLSQWRRVGSIRRASVVLVTGDAGIGKTRLIDELATLVAGEAVVVRSAYPPYGGSGGLRVGGDLVHQLGPSTDEAVQARVRSLTGDLDPSLQGIDPRALRQEQLWALRRLTEDRVQEHPVLVLIEDVHMASTSIELLTSFVSRVGDLPVLIVLSGRPEGKWLTSFPMANTVRIGPLSAADTNELASRWQPDLESRDRVVQMCGGNPLFLRELLAFAAEQAAGGAPRRRFPVSLRAVLAARLDGLRAAERMALQDLAVIGDLATVDQLVALGGATASEGVAALTAGGLVRHRPDGTLRITEPLLREVAYETLPKTVRVERHCRVAELTSSATERSRHLDRAADLAPDDQALQQRAADELAAAGRQALDESRPADGVQLLQRALDRGHRDPHTILRLANALIDRDRDQAISVLELVPEQSGDARVDAERVLVRANALVDREPQTALAEFDRAASLWHALGDHVKEGWAHSNKGVALFMAGDMHRSDAELSTALELFRAQDYRAGEMATVSMRALVRPDDPEVETWLDESLRYAVRVGDRSRHLAALSTLSWHHFLRTRLGGPVETLEAQTWVADYAALAAELGLNEQLLQGLCIQANLERMAGRLSGSRELVEQARRLGAVESTGERALLRSVAASVEPGSAFEDFDSNDPFSSIAAVVQTERAVMEGRFAELLLVTPRTERNRMGRQEALVGFVPSAIGLVMLGRHGEAEPLARRAMDAAAQSRSVTAEAAARAVLAECAVYAGQHDEATALLAGAHPVDGGLTGALLRRARASLGDPDALLELRHDADRLNAPGLLMGVFSA